MCVVFDVDDTLYLEHDYVKSGFRAVGRFVETEIGSPNFFEVAWSLFTSGRRGTIFDGTFESIGQQASPDLIKQCVEIYRRHEPTIDLLPDARQAILEVAPHMKVAVVTDGPEASQAAKVAALGLEAWCRPAILTAQLGSGFGKPNPRAFEIVESTHGVEGPGCVYVADNPAKDFEGPKSLGWRTIRVRRPLGLHAAAPDQGDVDLEVRDLSNLPALLDQL